MEAPPQGLPSYPHALNLTSLVLNNMIDPDANMKYIYLRCHVFTTSYSAIHGSPATLSPMV